MMELSWLSISSTHLTFFVAKLNLEVLSMARSLLIRLNLENRLCLFSVEDH